MKKLRRSKRGRTKQGNKKKHKQERKVERGRNTDTDRNKFGKKCQGHSITLTLVSSYVYNYVKDNKDGDTIQVLPLKLDCCICDRNRRSITGNSFRRREKTTRICTDHSSSILCCFASLHYKPCGHTLRTGQTF